MLLTWLVQTLILRLARSTLFGISFQFQRLALFAGWLLFKSLKRKINYSTLVCLIMISVLSAAFGLNPMLIYFLSVHSVSSAYRRSRIDQEIVLNLLVAWIFRSLKVIPYSGILCVLIFSFPIYYIRRDSNKAIWDGFVRLPSQLSL